MVQGLAAPPLPPLFDKPGAAPAVSTACTSFRWLFTNSLKGSLPITVIFPLLVNTIPSCSLVCSVNLRTAEKRCSLAFPSVILALYSSRLIF